MRDLPESIDRDALLATTPRTTGGQWDLDGLRALGLEPNEIPVDGLVIRSAEVQVTRYIMNDAGKMIPDGHNGGMTETVTIPLTGLWPDAARELFGEST